MITLNKKELIYDTALILFNKHGFDKTPTSMIAKEAGIATGTLFHYFSTKDELINGLYLKCKDSMLSNALKGTDNAKNYKDQMKITSKNLLRWSVECHEEFLFFHQFSNSALILDTTKKQGREKFNIIYDFITEGIEADMIKDIDPELIVNCITGMLSSISLYLMSKPELLKDDSFMEQAFILMWDAIKK